MEKETVDNEKQERLTWETPKIEEHDPVSATDGDPPFTNGPDFGVYS